MIYFIEAKDSGLIKIGYTDGDPEGRLSTLQVGSPARLIRLAVMAGNRIDEGRLHARFRSTRSHGEWFRDSPRLRAFIARKAVEWSGPLHPGTLVPARVAREWGEMLSYLDGLPGREEEIEALWPRVDGVKLDIEPALSRPPHEKPRPGG